jgi:hypothetical protein
MHCIVLMMNLDQMVNLVAIDSKFDFGKEDAIGI